MPRPAAEVVTINFRLPPKLHRSLEQIAKRKGASMNTEVVERLQRSVEFDKWPKVEDFATAMLMQAAGLPHADKLAQSLLEDLSRLLAGETPMHAFANLLNKQLGERVFTFPGQKEPE